VRLAPPLLLALLAGCARLPEAQQAVTRFVERPVIELVLQGGDAELVKAQAARYNGAVDLDAVALGCVLVYLSPEAYTVEKRKHECSHCRDFRAEGPAHGLRYAIEARKGYDVNAYEVRARAAETDPAAPTPDTDCR